MDYKNIELLYMIEDLQLRKGAATKKDIFDFYEYVMGTDWNYELCKEIDQAIGILYRENKLQAISFNIYKLTALGEQIIQQSKNVGAKGHNTY